MDNNKVDGGNSNDEMSLMTQDPGEGFSSCEQEDPQLDDPLIEDDGEGKKVSVHFGTSDNVGANDDSDERSVSSDSSDDDSQPQRLSYIERRSLRMQRNDKRLKTLGLHKSTPKKRKNTAVIEQVKSPRHVDAPRGMLLPARTVSTRLDERYPHRGDEIRALSCLLYHTPGIIPPPILVTGQSGVGKTSLVKDVVQRSMRTSAYVDCEILEKRSIEFILDSIYHQWEKALVNPKRRKRNSGKKKARRNKSIAVSGGTKTRSGGTIKRSDGGNSRGVGRSSSTSLLPSNASTLVHMFGRVAKDLLRDRGAVIILDNAELSLNLPARKNSVEHQSLLAQLLLLPKELKLNVSIVLITRSTLLEYARNDVLPTDHTRGSLDSAFNFSKVHFSAYSQKEMLVAVLCVPEVRIKVTGIEEYNHRCANSLYPAFVRTTVQYLMDSTVTTLDHIQFARRLWPLYLAPLDLTSASISPSKELVASLGQKLLPHIRVAIRTQASRVGRKLENRDIPVIARLMLMAAYLCQVNRADRDKYLLTIEKNGIRRKGTSGEQEKELSYEATANPKLPRLRSFPLERMLSVLVSLLGLNPEIVGGANIESRLESLGTPGIFQALSGLREMGLISEQPMCSPRDPIRLFGPRYTCSLAREEADSIAASMKFPLEKYLL